MWSEREQSLTWPHDQHEASREIDSRDTGTEATDAAQRGWADRQVDSRRDRRWIERIGQRNQRNDGYQVAHRNSITTPAASVTVSRLQLPRGQHGVSTGHRGERARRAIEVTTRLC